MDLRAALLERQTIHDYAPTALAAGVLDRAIEAALAAPNHRMTEPWRFIRVGQETRARLVEVAVRLKAPDGKPRPELIETTRRKMLNPAELLVVLRVRAQESDVEREDYAAIACAIQNLSLSLWAEGVGSKWSTGKVTEVSDTYQVLGVDAGALEIVGFVWVGLAAKPQPKTRRRKTLADVLIELP